jgi:hypothetical protein
MFLFLSVLLWKLVFLFKPQPPLPQPAPLSEDYGSIDVDSNGR